MATPVSRQTVRVQAIRLLVLAAFLFPLFVVASNGTGAGGGGGTGAGGGGISNPLQGCEDIRQCVENVVKYALGLAGVLALAGIVYGGFLYMTAGDNQDRIQGGKSAVTYSIIGLIIIGLAYAIVVFIFNALGGGGGP